MPAIPDTTWPQRKSIRRARYPLDWAATTANRTTSAISNRDAKIYRRHSKRDLDTDAVTYKMSARGEPGYRRAIDRPEPLPESTACP